jgi:hypothetical protein
MLGPNPVLFLINVAQFRQRIAAIAQSQTETLALELDGVEAERQPGVAWQVYVGLPANAAPDPTSPYYVGNVVLFGSGIRSEAHHGFKPAHFAFAINRAILAWLPTNEASVSVTFLPSPPNVKSTVCIGHASLTVETVPCTLPFRDVLRPNDINCGLDLGGSGHVALNFTGGA